MDGSILTLKYLNENLSQSTDTNPHVELIVPMETSNGRISIDQAASAVIELSTSNGSISGSVEGKQSDYAITSGTSNGDNSLRDGGKGALVMTAHTSNGNINIRFLGE